MQLSAKKNAKKLSSTDCVWDPLPALSPVSINGLELECTATGSKVTHITVSAESLDLQ